MKSLAKLVKLSINKIFLILGLSFLSACASDPYKPKAEEMTVDQKIEYMKARAELSKARAKNMHNLIKSNEQYVKFLNEPANW